MLVAGCQKKNADTATPPEATVVLRDGTRLTGAVLDMSAAQLTLKTPDGTSSDQPDNALRLVRPGIVRTLGSKSYAVWRASRDIALLLNESGYRTKAEHIARIVETENGVGVARDALENCPGRVA